MAEEFRAEIQGDIDSVSKAVMESETEMRTVDEQQAKFLEGAKSVERAIQQKTTELKQVIDRQADRLLREVNMARQQREGDVARRKNDVELNRLVLADFQKYSQQLKDKGIINLTGVFTAHPTRPQLGEGVLGVKHPPPKYICFKSSRSIRTAFVSVFRVCLT